MENIILRIMENLGIGLGDMNKNYCQQLIKFMLTFGFSKKRQTFNKPICFNGKISDFSVAQIL